MQNEAEGGETRTVQQGQTYTATQSGAVAGREYVLLVRQAGTTGITANDLYFIDQKTAESGTVSFTYVPRGSGECTVEIFGDFRPQPVSCTVTWNVDGAVTEQQIEEGAPITKPADPVKEGYTFTGWSPEVPATMPAQDMTFTAQFTVNSYTVTWIADGETKTDTVAFGAPITKPADPVKEGYTFTGWSPEVPATMPANDLTFTAQFKENETPPAGKVRGVTANDLTLTYKTGGTITPVVTADDGVTYTVAYSGFDNAIISVDQNGKVTTLKKGTTTVTVTVTDDAGNTAETTCTVTVKYAFWQVLIRIFLLGFLWY